jgi:hypothetical protein
MQPPTNEVVESLPSIVMTSGDDWDPTVQDNNITNVKEWCNSIKEESDGLIAPPNPFGEHLKQPVVSTSA